MPRVLLAKINKPYRPEGRLSVDRQYETYRDVRSSQASSATVPRNFTISAMFFAVSFSCGSRLTGHTTP